MIKKYLRPEDSEPQQTDESVRGHFQPPWFTFDPGFQVSARQASGLDPIIPANYDPTICADYDQLASL